MNRRFLWSLLFALLLPLAQVAAAAHEVSHARTASDAAGLPALHCDLCDVATNLTSGVPGPAPALLHVPAQPVKPTWHAPAPHAARAATFFLSRAPPSLH